MIRNNGTVKQLAWIPMAVIAIAIFSQSKPHAEFNVTNVSVSDANALVDSGAVVVDVRGKEAFDTRHIPGALNIPVDVLRTSIPATLAASKDAPVVVYCGDGSTLGPEGTSLLNKAGFSKAVNVRNGIQGWADAGLKVAH